MSHNITCLWRGSFEKPKNLSFEQWEVIIARMIKYCCFLFDLFFLLFKLPHHHTAYFEEKEGSMTALLSFPLFSFLLHRSTHSPVETLKAQPIYIQWQASITLKRSPGIKSCIFSCTLCVSCKQQQRAFLRICVIFQWEVLNWNANMLQEGKRHGKAGLKCKRDAKYNCQWNPVLFIRHHALYLVDFPFVVKSFKTNAWTVYGFKLFLTIVRVVSVRERNKKTAQERRDSLYIKV